MSLQGHFLGKKNRMHARYLKQTGKTIICASGNPSKSGNEGRAPWQHTLGGATKEYWRIRKTPELLAEYQTAYKQLPRTEKENLTLRQFIYKQLTSGYQQKGEVSSGMPA